MALRAGFWLMVVPSAAAHTRWRSRSGARPGVPVTARPHSISPTGAAVSVSAPVRGRVSRLARWLPRAAKRIPSHGQRVRYRSAQPPGQRPKHAHNYYGSPGDDYATAYTGGSNNFLEVGSSGATTDAQYTGITVLNASAANASAAHNNMPPWVGMNYIVRVQ